MNFLLNLFSSSSNDRKYSTHKVIQNSDLIKNLIINTIDKYLVSVKKLDPTYTDFQNIKSIKNGMYFNLDHIKEKVVSELILKVDTENYYELSNYNFSLFSPISSIYGIISNISKLIKYNSLKSSKNGNIILLSLNSLNKEFYIIKCVESERFEVYELKLYDLSINRLKIKNFVWHSVFNNVILCFDDNFLISFELNENLTLLNKIRFNGIIRASYSPDGK